MALHARHNWTETDLKQAPRNVRTSRGNKKSMRAGGVPEWLASKRAMKKMCIDFFCGVARNIGSKMICIMYRYKIGTKEG